MSEENKVGFKLEDGKHVPVNAEGKTLDISDIKGARANISDIKVFGNGDTFRLICKASSQAQGWMKSTKGMDTGNGVVLQVSTQQRNPDGSYAVAEAITFVPHVTVDQLIELHKVEE